jgi:hypothetical protein
MGYVGVLGNCVACGRLFYFSPTKVPSLIIAGEREPVCASCVEWVNPIRLASGLDPIVPLPGAYEPDDESEL